MAGVNAAFDFHDALPDSKPVKKKLVSWFKKKRAFGCDNIILVLQAEIDLSVGIAKNVNRQQ